jgi:hypothetical protein
VATLAAGIGFAGQNSADRSSDADKGVGSYKIAASTQILSHTSVEMPVWGPIFGKINQKDPRDRVVRIQALTAYLEGIQQK